MGIKRVSGGSKAQKKDVWKVSKFRSGEARSRQVMSGKGIKEVYVQTGQVRLGQVRSVPQTWKKLVAVVAVVAVLADFLLDIRLF